MGKDQDSSLLDDRTISYIGFRVKIWVYNEEAPFIGDCVEVFLLGETYFLGINFEGENDIVGVCLSDIRMIKKLKKTTRHLEVVSLDMIKKESTQTGN